MSQLVIFFFIFATLSILLSGLLLPRRVPTPSSRHFGTGLVLTGVAFVVWTYAVVTKPGTGTLETIISIGALFFLAALFFFLWSGVSAQPKSTQQYLVVGGFIFAVILWVVRAAYPSQPGFSSEGLFFFNPHPIVKFMYIVFMSAAVFPAISTVGSEMRKKHFLSANIFIASMIAAVLGGVLLLVSTENILLYLVGWGLGISYLLLLLTVLGVFSTSSARRS